MKRSRAVHAFLVVSATTALTDCGQRHEAVRRCVDESGNFTDDRNCAATPASTGGRRYAWVYAPVGASNKAEEDSPEAAAKATEAAAKAATRRGVIGGEGAAHGAEAGPGAGE